MKIYSFEIQSLSTIQKFADIVERLVNSGFNRIVLLRYKPLASIDRWKAENPGSEQMSQIHERIGRIIREKHTVEYTRGCQVFAEDGLGGEPGCPEPLQPPLTRLEKIGRSLDYEQGKFMMIVL